MFGIMTKPIGLEAFLDKTFFALDTLSMLSDIEDFIDFSEGNIDWQKRRELNRVELACAADEFDDPHEAAQYHVQTIDGVRYRFEVCLAQRVRYAALSRLDKKPRTGLTKNRIENASPGRIAETRAIKC